MFLRAAAFACATAMIAALAAPANAEPSGRCEASSFRVYFAHGSSRLSPAAQDLFAAAARNVEGCAYAELHVALNASSPLAARRAASIRTAAGEGWDTVRVAPLMLTNASTGPEYAEVVMTPYPAATLDTAAPAETDAGV